MKRKGVLTCRIQSSATSGWEVWLDESDRVSRLLGTFEQLDSAFTFCECYGFKRQDFMEAGAWYVARSNPFAK